MEAKRTAIRVITRVVFCINVLLILMLALRIWKSDKAEIRSPNLYLSLIIIGKMLYNVINEKGRLTLNTMWNTFILISFTIFLHVLDRPSEVTFTRRKFGWNPNANMAKSSWKDFKFIATLIFLVVIVYNPLLFVTNQIDFSRVEAHPEGMGDTSANVKSPTIKEKKRKGDHKNYDNPTCVMYYMNMNKPSTPQPAETTYSSPEQDTNAVVITELATELSTKETQTENALLNRRAEGIQCTLLTRRKIIKHIPKCPICINKTTSTMDVIQHFKQIKLKETRKTPVTVLSPSKSRVIPMSYKKELCRQIIALSKPMQSKSMKLPKKTGAIKGNKREKILSSYDSKIFKLDDLMSDPTITSSCGIKTENYILHKPFKKRDSYVDVIFIKGESEEVKMKM